MSIYRWFLGVVGRSHGKTSRNLFRLFQFAVLATAVILILNLSSLFFEDNPGFGSFGDFFGGMLNPILTFLTFMGLLITIILQQNELRLTRQELRTSSQALSEQSITLKKQRFEDTFFSLFSQHNNILQSITTIDMRQNSNDESILSHVHGFCFGRGFTLCEAKVALSEENHLVGHYFRILYQLLKLIATKSPESPVVDGFDEDILNSNPACEDEKMYANIVRSVLNQEITQLLAVNCYSDDDNDQYRRYRVLIKRYQFLEHMPFIARNDAEQVLIECIDYYGKECFGDNEFVETNYGD